MPLAWVVPPWLELPYGSTYSASTRTFSPGQPAWNNLASAGAQLARVVITGTQGRQVVYFPLSGNQTAVRVPDSPMAPGLDPCNEAAARLEVVALDLSAGVTVEDALDLAGPNLSALGLNLDGYSRYAP